ncbi:MAG: hypothetical protein QN122_08025 [Armatimonadota bacterium]|nr:hypothetical protein [Armatimonadota bacterium]MDR7448170.1 hypothetical protein [Armatimonadota bacterium]MDR7458897.1 hypothetical protein [Armatimonadota bacterium]MDR7479183.1 hypothetical protein [Armatimonadota bacterium]MDR7487605.1 hypothetical protein [Armatimonadota bacterium]
MVTVRTTTARMAMLCTLALGLAAALTAAAPAFPALAQGAGHQHAPAPQATPEQQAAAAHLLAAVRAGIARFADRQVAEAEGYRQSGPWRFQTWGPAHFGNPLYRQDGRLLDPQRPEGLVYLKLPEGREVLLGAFFVAPRGQGPRPGGPLTEWHSHECLTGDGRRLRSEGGACPPGTELRPARVEMLHVWTFDNPDGPFAHALTRRAIEAAVQAARR